MGHTSRKETEATEKTALDWNPQGYRRRGRPKRTWRGAIEDGIRSIRRSWNEFKGIAGYCNAWKLFMDTLCSTRSERIWWWWLYRTSLLIFPIWIKEPSQLDSVCSLSFSFRISRSFFCRWLLGFQLRYVNFKGGFGVECSVLCNGKNALGRRKCCLFVHTSPLTGRLKKMTNV